MAPLTADVASTGIDYRKWQRDSVRVGARSVRLATKPGLFAHGADDPAALLLATHATVAPGDRVLHLNCGNGLFGAAAALAGATVTLADRNVLSFEAASRTVQLNGIASARAFLSHGTAGMERHDERAGLDGFDVAGIRIPHDRLSQLQLLLDAFRALRVGGTCYIAGAGNEGIKPAARSLERLFGNGNVRATGSGHRVVRATKTASDIPPAADEFAHPLLRHDVFHEISGTLRGQSIALCTRPGVFSWEHPDEATTILADVMEIRRGDRALDLGCGCGALGAVAGTIGADVTMLDADSEAVRCALRTAAGAGVANARALPSDITSAVQGEQFDVVLTNPPFHVGKATSLGLPVQFIDEAWAALAPGGRLQLVANRTLPYEAAIAGRFGNMAILHDGPRFKVLSAVK